MKTAPPLSLARILDCWNNRVPVSPVLIGERLGLEFREKEEMDFRAGFRKQEGRLVALYRPCESVALNRFITGRLLARFAERETEGDEGILPLNDWPGMLALRILMPDSALRFAVRVSKTLDTVAKMASYFNVPDAAVRWRLDNFLGERVFAKKGTPDRLDDDIRPKPALKTGNSPP